LPGVHIDDGAIIGANAVVAKDVPPYAVVVGNPAVTKKYRFDKETIDFLLELKWWDKDIEEIKKLIPLLTGDLSQNKKWTEEGSVCQLGFTPILYIIYTYCQNEFSIKD
jgi:virginiamycin A acetyltransferase